jgi:site-specific DNA-methyltransferase (adenine-specific)
MNDKANALLKLDKATQMLAEVRSATEAKKVMDMAGAAKHFAQKFKLGEEAITHAHGIKIAAQTMLGRYLREMPKAKGGRPCKTPPVDGGVFTTLDELGLTYNDSSDAQFLSALQEIAPDKHSFIEKNEKSIADVRREHRIEARRARKMDALSRNGHHAATDRWSITLGDCIDVLKSIKDGSVRLVFADPPYNLGIDYGNGKRADSMAVEEYYRWCEAWMALCVRKLAPDGSMWVMICREHADMFGLTLKKMLTIRSWIIWYETFGVNCANNFNRTSRHIFYCVKNRARFTFNRDAVLEDSLRISKYKDKRANPEGKILDDVWQVPRVTGTSDERIPDFPTQLPVEILRRIVESCSNPGDLVVDPFCGSGTTGVACIRWGRRFIGIEKQQKYVERAKLRLAGVTPVCGRG